MFTKFTEQQKKLLAALFIIALLVLGNIGYQYYQSYSLQQQAIAFCDVQHQTCQISFAEDKNVELSIKPQKIVLGTDIRFHVRFQGITAQKVQLYLSNDNPRVNTVTVDLHKTADDEYVGTGQFPLASDPSPQWQILVKFQSSLGDVAVPFKVVLD